ALREKHVGLRPLERSVVQPVAVFAQDLIVGGGVGVDLERKAGRDLPVVPVGEVAARLRNVEPFAILLAAKKLFYQEPRERALVLLGEDVAELALDAHTPSGKRVERERQIHAVVDGPEVGNLQGEAFPVRAAVFRKEEARLSLTLKRHCEKRHPRDKGDL